MSDFAVGDVVILNSGGPAMTVNYIIGSGNRTADMQAKYAGCSDGDVACTWFDDKEVLQRSFFLSSTIKKSV